MLGNMSFFNKGMNKFQKYFTTVVEMKKKQKTLHALVINFLYSAKNS